MAFRLWPSSHNDKRLQIFPVNCTHWAISMPFIDVKVFKVTFRKSTDYVYITAIINLKVENHTEGESTIHDTKYRKMAIYGISELKAMTHSTATIIFYHFNDGRDNDNTACKSQCNESNLLETRMNATMRPIITKCTHIIFTKIPKRDKQWVIFYLRFCGAVWKSMWNTAGL